jgi:hypothetical protein
VIWTPSSRRILASSSVARTESPPRANRLWPGGISVLSTGSTSLANLASVADNADLIKCSLLPPEDSTLFTGIAPSSGCCELRRAPPWCWCWKNAARRSRCRRGQAGPVPHRLYRTVLGGASVSATILSTWFGPSCGSRRDQFRILSLRAARDRRSSALPCYLRVLLSCWARLAGVVTSDRKFASVSSTPKC